MKVTDNFKEAEEWIDDLTEVLEESMRKSMKAVVGVVYDNLTMPPGDLQHGTPRDTLRATNGWNVRGGPVVSYEDVGIQDDSGNYPNLGYRAERGERVGGVSSESWLNSSFDTVFPEPLPTEAVLKEIADTDTKASVANGVPYIGDLNNGTSKQTAGGFVERAVHKGIRSIENFDLTDPKTISWKRNR